MSEFALETRNQLVGLFGIVERNMYLTKRYFLWDLAFMVWTIANTLTIVFIARAIPGITPAQENNAAALLLVGATIWAFLGIIFEFMTETVAWERWEGTIEYTFMAPLSRFVHLFGQGAYAVLYGLIRATILFFAVAAFIGIHMPNANFGAALALLAIASVSFIGVGIMTSVLSLISPEKGAQLGFVCQGLMLVVLASTTRSASCRSGCSGCRRSRLRRTRCAAAARRSSTAPACSGRRTCGRC